MLNPGLTPRVESACVSTFNSLKVHPFQAVGFKLTQPAPPYATVPGGGTFKDTITTGDGRTPEEKDMNTL